MKQRKPQEIKVLLTIAKNSKAGSGKGKKSCKSSCPKPVEIPTKRKREKSPQPSISGLQANIENTPPTSENEEDEKDCCCVCKKFSPPAMRNCDYLVILKWAECVRCGHWTHLKFAHLWLLFVGLEIFLSSLH